DLLLQLGVAAAAASKGRPVHLSVVSGVAGMVVPTTVPYGPVEIACAAGLFGPALSALLALGPQLSARVSLVITLIKVGVVLLVIVVGAAYITPDNSSPSTPPAKAAEESGPAIEQSQLSLLLGGETSTYGVFGLLAAASLVFFAFIGFDVVATTAEETKNPQRDAPRGIFGTLLIVTVLYVAV